MFSSWEPSSNLECEDLISEFQSASRKRSWQHDAAAANDLEAKKRKVTELVDQLLILEPQLTALGLVDLYEELDASKVGQISALIQFLTVGVVLLIIFFYFSL